MLPDIVAGTSGGVIHTDVLTIPFTLSGTETLTVGRERNGEIPVVIKAATGHFAASPVSTFFCLCARAVAAKTCGGTWLEPDGVTPSPDCTPDYTAGDSVCAGKNPCASVHGPGNAASGVIGCAGLDGVNASVEQDGTGVVSCNSDADCALNRSCLTTHACAPAPPRVTLAGAGRAGSALLLASRAIGSAPGLCSGTGPAYGPDGEFCTTDDPQRRRGTVITAVLTTGTASGVFTNASGLEDNTIGPFTVAGSPLQCSALAGPHPLAFPGALASVWTAPAGGPLVRLLFPKGGIENETELGHRVLTELLIAAPAASCVGDCNSDGQVTIDELLTLVNIGLSSTPLSRCTVGDGTGDGHVTVDEIITAVNWALAGCSQSRADHSAIRR